MKIYKLDIEFTKEGNLVPRWADDSCLLLDMDLHKPDPLIDTWPSDLSFRASAKGKDCDVLYNADAILYSQGTKESLSSELSEVVEWLPVGIDDSKWYILHPLIAVEPGPGIEGTVNPVSKNMTSVTRYDFPRMKEVPLVFCLHQLAGSAARQGGYNMRETLLSEAGAGLFKSISGLCITLVYDG